MGLSAPPWSRTAAARTQLLISQSLCCARRPRSDLQRVTSKRDGARSIKPIKSGTCPSRAAMWEYWKRENVHTQLKANGSGRAGDIAGRKVLWRSGKREAGKRTRMDVEETEEGSNKSRGESLGSFHYTRWFPPALPSLQPAEGVSLAPSSSPVGHIQVDASPPGPALVTISIPETMAKKAQRSATSAAPGCLSQPLPFGMRTLEELLWKRKVTHNWICSCFQALKLVNECLLDALCAKTSF